jgi:hypothetical protein
MVMQLTAKQKQAGKALEEFEAEQKQAQALPAIDTLTFAERQLLVFQQKRDVKKAVEIAYSMASLTWFIANARRLFSFVGNEFLESLIYEGEIRLKIELHGIGTFHALPILSACASGRETFDATRDNLFRVEALWIGEYHGTSLQWARSLLVSGADLARGLDLQACFTKYVQELLTLYGERGAEHV